MNCCAWSQGREVSETSSLCFWSCDFFKLHAWLPSRHQQLQLNWKHISASSFIFISDFFHFGFNYHTHIIYCFWCLVTIALANTLYLDGTPDDGTFNPYPGPTLMDSYDYVMHGRYTINVLCINTFIYYLQPLAQMYWLVMLSYLYAVFYWCPQII